MNNSFGLGSIGETRDFGLQSRIVHRFWCVRWRVTYIGVGGLGPHKYSDQTVGQCLNRNWRG